MRLTFRRWAIVALGAGAALPFGVRVPFGATGTLPVDVLIWPFLVVALVLTETQEWRGLWRDAVARVLLGYLVASAVSLPIGVVDFHNTAGIRSYLYAAAIVANFAVGYLVLRQLDDIKLLLGGFVVSIGMMSSVLNLYLLESGVLLHPHSIHNSLFLIGFIYGWPNAFSILVAVAAVTATYLSLTATTTRSRTAYTAFAVSLAVCLVLTFSKTGWLSAAVAAWLLVLRNWSWRRQLAVLACLLGLGVALYFVGNSSLRTQLFTLETLAERFTIVADVFRYVNPLYIAVGSGSQSLETLFAPHANVQVVPTLGLATLSAHDEFVNVLVKGGAASLALFALALIIVMVRTGRLARSLDTRLSVLFRYWQAASWAIIASLFSGEELRYWPVAVVFWLVAGAAVSLVPSPHQLSADRRSRCR